MQIFKSAFIISFFTIISRISGFVRDMLVAKIVGSGFYADIFFASFKITNLLRKLLAEGSLFAAFVPSFAQIKEKYGNNQAREFSVKMLSITFYTLFVIIVVSNLFMPQITRLMAPGFEGAKLQETISLSYIVIWYLLFVCLVSVLSAVLNSLHKFSYYAIVPIFLNLVLIVFILFFQHYFENIALCLAYGVICGGVIQFLFVYFACVYEKFAVYIKFPSRKLFDENTKMAYKKMLPAIIGGGLTQINTMIDMILGSYIISGISYLYYADRIFYLPTSVIGTAISIVILPFISKQIAHKNIAGADRLIGEAIQLSSIFVLPAACVLFVLADIVTSIVFQRGAFNSTDVHFVSSMLKILAIGLPFCVLNKVTSAIFFSYSDTKNPMYITLLSVFVNVITSISLMPKLGIYAIVCGTSFSYFFSFCISIVWLKLQNRIHITPSMLFFIGKVGIMSAIVTWLARLVVNHKIYGYYTLIYETTLVIKLLYISLVGVICAISYFAIGFILKINIVRIAMKKD